MTRHRIALIEDDTVQQIIFKAMLQDNFSVQVYGGYVEALQSFNNNDNAKPDLILCDMSLPDGDGIALRRALQKNEALRSCPFIFLTGMDDNSIKRQAIDIGIDDYLKKPIKKETLLEVLDRTLQRSRQLQRAVDEHINHQLVEPLQPFVPERIGPYRLTLAHQQVIAGGGDFVFHLRAVDTDFIIVGDIMGHGAPAKFFMHAYAGYIYGMVQSFQHYYFTPTAADLLHILNRTLTTDSFLQRWLLTCLIICLPTEDDISVAHAGHPFSWLIGKDGPKALSDKSVMPGLLADAVFTNVSVPLQTGERLLFTTDGVNFEPHATDHLADMSFLSLTTHLMKRADERDDATILLIERV